MTCKGQRGKHKPDQADCKKEKSRKEKRARRKQLLKNFLTRNGTKKESADGDTLSSSSRTVAEDSVGLLGTRNRAVGKQRENPRMGEIQNERQRQESPDRRKIFMDKGGGVIEPHPGGEKRDRHLGREDEIKSASGLPAVQRKGEWPCERKRQKRVSGELASPICMRSHSPP